MLVSGSRVYPCSAIICCDPLSAIYTFHELYVMAASDEERASATLCLPSLTVCNKIFTIPSLTRLPRNEKYPSAVDLLKGILCLRL